ncbi:MAG: hypothetical protein K2H22_04980 [Muribaculaceae bacterium]|nr:hypothetical protein [Muribaculaceae bacterium]
MAILFNVCISCEKSDSSQFGDFYDEYRYNYCPNLRFTDIGYPDGYCEAELISVDSSARTIKLTLKERLDHVSIMPEEYYVNVRVWSDDYMKWEQKENTSSYYHIETLKENDEPVIHIELKENGTGEDRSFRLHIRSEVGYGAVDILQKAPQTTGKFFLKAKYKDRFYTTEAETDSNGDISFSDPEYSSLMEKIDSMDDVRMMIMDDSTIFYYDREDAETNQAYNDILSLASNDCDGAALSTRADGFEYDDPSYLGYFAIFDKDHFNGLNMSKGLTDFDFTYNIQYLHNLNDKVTSIAVGYNSCDPLVCSVLTIWEDSDFNHWEYNTSKRRISIIASRNSPKTSIPDLKKIKRIGSSKSWNDCISSISFHFGYIDRLLLDY